MTSSLLQGKRFYCREWAISKLLHCLDNRPSAKTCGALIMGGPGCGKTALCCDVVWPTSNHGRQAMFTKRVLAYYFCQAHDIETLSITSFIHCIVEQLSKSPLIQGYVEQLQEPEIQAVLDPLYCERNPDEAFRKSILLPLSAITPPSLSMALVVDSIDESYLQIINEKHTGSQTIAELLANNNEFVPQWLLLLCSARKQSKAVTRLFTGFRKISLDDLRKSHVVRDVQQYILCRLDQEEALRQHLSRETAERLNQLHIKSNGCFLYLEKVLDGVADNFILLREIREIPGTLNGLYLWLCQRLFVRKQFAKVQPILNVILAARRPLTEMELYSCAYTRNTSLNFEEFQRRMELLLKILIEGRDGTKILFHHSFAEWLLDVKHCTQKYLCTAAEGHGMLAMSFTMHAPSLTPMEIQDFALHLAKSNLITTLEPYHMALWMLQTGAKVEHSLMSGLPKEKAVLQLLNKAGAILPSPEDVAAAAAAAAATTSPVSGKPASGASGGIKLASDEEDMLSQMLEKGTSMDELDSNGRSMLCSAAHQGNLKLITRLLTKNVRLEVVDKTGQTAMNLAARQGYAEVVGILLVAGACVDHADKDGWTALRSAAWGGHTEVVIILLEAGAEVDHADSDQRTALRAAAWGGHDDIVIRLLEHGANVNKVDNEGRTALIAAAYMGHTDIVCHLLDHGANINHEDIDGRTALSVAALCIPASEGHTSVVSLLLDREAEVDHRDHDGMTPLLVAAYEGHHDVCELLLEADADVDHADNNGRTPLQAAASMGHNTIVSLLLFWGAAIDAIDADGRTVLCIAAQQGNPDVVRQLLDRGLDEQHRDNAGWTPLHVASFEGHKEVTLLVLESGARISEVDNEGRVAIILAAQEGHLPVVSALLESGSPIEARAHDGKTSLRVAALEGHKDVVHYLLCHGADVNYKDADGRSTLYVLALENHVPMAAFLCENGADVEGYDLEGRTPLHVASWQGHFEMTDLLISFSANANGTDNDCRTALQSGAWQGHSNIVKLLLEKGALIDHSCNQGATALCIAAQEGHEDVVKILLQFGANPHHADQYGRTATRVALKGGHSSVVRIMEDFTSNASGRRPPPPNSGAANKTSSTSSKTDMSPTNAPVTKKITRPSKPPVSAPPPPSQALASAMAIANGHFNLHSSPSESLNSTSDRRKLAQSNHSSSLKSTGTNLNNTGNSSSTNKSSSSGGGLDVASPAGLTFTQQLQQCSISKNRNRPLSRVLSPVSEPLSASHSPAASPLSDVHSGPHASPDMQSPTSHSLTSPRHASAHHLPASGGSGGNLVRIISNPSSTDASSMYDNVDEPVWQKQPEGGTGSGGHSSSSVKSAKLELKRKGSLPEGPVPMGGMVMGQAALAMKSPESRRKRNGIVTNPNFSMTKNVSVNGYFNKLAETVDNFHSSPNSMSAPNGNMMPSSSLPTKRATRPNGLPLKKETPL